MIGSEIIEFQSLTSTSNYVAKALREGVYRSGVVILSHFQTEGRGQRGNTWQSEPGRNLTFSFAFKAETLGLRDQFLYSKAVSVGVIRFLEAQKMSFVCAKWPNDILVSSKKIAGILIESIPIKKERYLVVGIGLNVNQKEFADDLQATSMRVEIGRSLDLKIALKQLTQSLNTSLSSIKKDGGSRVHQDYMSSLFGADSWVNLQQNERQFTGRIRNVDNEGVMLVASKQGFPSSFRPGEVRIDY